MNPSDGPADVNRDYDRAAAEFTAWYIGPATQIRSPRALVRETCLRFLAHGVPLQRFSAFLLMLHPDYFGASHRWMRGNDDIKTSRGGYAIWNSPVLQASPYGEINRGAAALRCRLEPRPERVEYDVLKEYLDDGATDYVIMHLPFSDGGRHAAAFATDRPGGFSTAELRLMDAMLPHMARQSELLTLRYLTTTLLDTYVGRKSGERVLTGQIRRGSGETIRAVVWLSDLRGFTALSEHLPGADLVALLNAYFDCVGGAIEKAGGEILKFIGDAVLAIFPLTGSDSLPDVGRTAVAAALAAREGLGKLRAVPGGEALDFGTALHVGDVHYGNIGTAGRLDFTVIGPTVNRTARIESLTSALGEPILVSAEVAAALAGGVESVGYHRLKGVPEPVEVFRPAPAI